MKYWWRFVLIVLFVLFVAVSGYGLKTQPSSAQPSLVCGGIFTPLHYELKPGEVTELTVASTEGALSGDVVRSLDASASGFLVGYGGENNPNSLSHLTSEGIENCPTVMGHVNAVWIDDEQAETMHPTQDVWAVTDGAGAFQFHQGVWKNYLEMTNTTGSTDGRGYTIAHDSQSDVFIGTYTGLAYFSAKSQAWATAKGQDATLQSLLVNPKAGDQIHAILLLGSEETWYGSIQTYGVQRLAGNGWQNYTAENTPELASNNIRVIREAPDHTIWVGGDPGLAVFDRSSGTWRRVMLGEGPDQDRVIDVRFSGTEKDFTTVVATLGGTFVLQQGQTLLFDTAPALALAVNEQEAILAIGTNGQGLHLGMLP